MYIVLVISLYAVEDKRVNLEIELVPFVYSVVNLLAVVIDIRILVGHKLRIFLVVGETRLVVRIVDVEIARKVFNLVAHNCNPRLSV